MNSPFPQNSGIINSHTHRSMIQSTNSNLYHSSPLKKSKSKISKFEHLMLIVQIALQYCDQFTDLGVIMYMASIMVRDGKLIVKYFILVIFMGKFLLLERIYSFKCCYQLQKKILKLKQRSNPQSQFSNQKTQQNFTFWLKMKIFFINLFFLDPILYFELIKNGGNVTKYRFYQKLSDLVTENMFFGALGLMIFFGDLSKQRPIGILIPLSIFFSITSAISILLQVYFVRMEKYQKMIPQNYENFYQLPLELQLEISNPCHFQITKFNSDVVLKNKNYLIEDRQKNTPGKMVNNSFLDSPILAKSRYRVSIKKKIYVSVVVIILFLSQIGTLGVSIISEKSFQAFEIFSLGVVLYIPHIWVYSKINLKQCSNSKEKIKFIAKMILSIPLISIIGGNTYVLPFIDHELPFLPEIRDNYMFNFYPTYIPVLVRQSYQIYQTVYLILIIFVKEEFNYTDKLILPDKEQFLPYIQEEWGTFYSIFIVILVFNALTLLINISYLVEKLFRKSRKSKQDEIKRMSKSTDATNNNNKHHFRESPVTEIPTIIGQVDKQNLNEDYLSPQLPDLTEGELQIVDETKFDLKNFRSRTISDVQNSTIDNRILINI